MKFIVTVTPKNGVPIWYTSLHQSAAYAIFDAMERYGHDAKISVKRLEEV